MKKIFAGQVLSLLPIENGFLFAVKHPTDDGRMAVAYKMVSFDKSRIESVTRNVYLLHKFGGDFKSFEMQFSNHIACHTVPLNDGKLFASMPDGSAKLFDKAAYTEWQGYVRYKEHGPGDAAKAGHTLWVSFPDGNALIRFNLITMRDELRMGGEDQKVFSKPEGLWTNDDEQTMLVCNAGSNKILEVNLNSYTVYEYAEFEEPVHKYIKVGGFEIVLLDSGLYRL